MVGVTVAAAARLVRRGHVRRRAGGRRPGGRDPEDRRRGLRGAQRQVARRDRRSGPSASPALRKIADRVFDWGEIARSSLGSSWRNLDAEQRTRFVEVFKDILAAQYMDDIDRFRGTETVTVDGSKPQGEDTVVNTTLTTSSRDRVPIDYRMRKQKGEWKVVDLSIEGVSLVNHFRKTFASALANMSLDQLIERLKRQLPK